MCSAGTANVTDRKGALEIFKLSAPKLTQISKVLCDGGFSGENFASAQKILISAEVEIAKRNELDKFAVIPRRWVVEITFACLENFRRLWKNCERKMHTSIQMTSIAFIALLLKRY